MNFLLIYFVTRRDFSTFFEGYVCSLSFSNHPQKKKDLVIYIKMFKTNIKTHRYKANTPVYSNTACVQTTE